MRRKVIKALKPLDAVAVENPANPGTPDVNYVEGWLELKWKERWPPMGGVLRIPHFTPQQKIWLRRRSRKGGCAYLLLNVAKDWLLFDGEDASIAIGEGTKDELFSIAIRTWFKFPGDELCEFLS